MSYQFARICLPATTYQPTVDWKFLTDPNVPALRDIYKTYCAYKKFASVMPLFDSQFFDTNTDVIGYYDQKQLVAFSLMKRYDNKNVLASQFAWTYHNPKTRLGVESLKTECAIYREQGFEYLYLDQAHLYKQGLEGFEILGTLQ
ncbi:hypothetical protein UFOVP328_242 [uncultured Caudovirales phage]|uniref:Uncharacterized protein n=1 Tax=uncultured Caudovirales phage TaxID=2100421 RepID=A0A6J5M1Z8_9CAUD|nr:hypothetical protein UFOVP328_242 [uncultured Caudovirales phage]